MRLVLACLAAVGLLAACSRAPAASASPANAASAAPAASSAPVSGVYEAGGKPALLTDVTAHNDDPFDGKPVVAIVFSVLPQGGDADADSDAHQNKFGDALVIRVEP